MLMLWFVVLHRGLSDANNKKSTNVRKESRQNFNRMNRSQPKVKGGGRRKFLCKQVFFPTCLVLGSSIPKYLSSRGKNWKISRYYIEINSKARSFVLDSLMILD